MVASALVVLLVAPVSARAGTYQVRACFPDVPNRSWSSIQPNGHVAAYDACGNFFEGLVSRNSLARDEPARFFENAHMEIVAPLGAFFTGLHADMTSGETMTSGFGPWRSGIQDETGWIDCGDVFPCRYDTNVAYAHRDLTGRHTRLFRIETVCAALSGCPRDQQYARTRLRAVTVDVRDDTLPQVSSARDAYWDDGWVGGTRPVGFDAVDNTGIQRMRAEIDPGGAHGFGWPGDAGFGCDYTLTIPCGDHSLDTAIDTTAMPDGTHTLRLCALDGAGNWNCLPDHPLHVDNTPVGKVRASTLQGDGGWRAQNGFTIGFAAPASEADGLEHAPIVRRHVQVCRLDGAECETSAVDGAGSSVPVAVPGPGEWKARVWLEDAAGHDAAVSGNEGDWVTLRYDPTAPGAAEPQGREGWTNAAELPDFGVRLGDGEAVGPSGIRGYAVTTDGTLPGTAPTASATPDGGARYPAGVPLAGLPEGVTMVRARAITGAGVAASDDAVGATEVRVDRTPPALSAVADGGGGDGWERRPVEVALGAQDQPGLAGIDRIEYQVDDGPVQRVALADPGAGSGPPAGDASVTVADDGTHTLTARAFDAAGNASPSRAVTVRIDRTTPQGGFDPPDPSDPTKVSVTVSDRCIRSAAIQLRRAGADWVTLPTQVADGRVTAHVPDDAYRSGAYEVRAVVTDCAGNTAVLDRWVGGADSGRKVVVTLPLRLKTALRMTLDRPPLVRVCTRARNGRRTCRRVRRAVAPARARSLSGVLRTLDGKPVERADVRLEVQRKGQTAWRRVATRRTDAKGVVHATAPAGPSRVVRLVYAGSQRLYASRSGTARFAVRASSTIMVSRGRLRNGQTVRLSGRLLGGFVPRGGREVELDGLNPLRRRWQPVQTRGLRTRGDGRWSARYRFTATRGRITYRFRLRIAPAWGYPFEEGWSRVVRVTVTG